MKRRRTMERFAERGVATWCRHCPFRLDARALPSKNMPRMAAHYLWAHPDKPRDHLKW